MINAMKGGCVTRHPSTFQMLRSKGLPNFVILIVRSRGEFWIGNEFFSIVPPKVIILAPDTVYSYGNPHGDYVDDWLHFEIEQPDFYQQLLSMSNKPFPIDNLNLFSFCIRQILWERFYNHSSSAQTNMNALFTLMFNHLLAAYEAKENLEKSSPFKNQLQLLRLEMENSVYEKHSIREHAQKLNISESYFQFLYKRTFGVSFGQDLIQMRVEYAKNIMTTSNLTLEQVAEICGYTNEIHFYRQFKKLTGTTPAKFRKKAELNV